MDLSALQYITVYAASHTKCHIEKIANGPIIHKITTKMLIPSSARGLNYDYQSYLVFDRSKM